MEKEIPKAVIVEKLRAVDYNNNNKKTINSTILLFVNLLIRVMSFYKSSIFPKTVTIYSSQLGAMACTNFMNM